MAEAFDAGAEWEPPLDPRLRAAARRARMQRLMRTARTRADELWHHLPPDALDELRSAVLRLRQARSPREAVAAFEAETDHLFTTVAPAFVTRPLPLATARRALLTVTFVAGAAAAVEEIEALALLIPGVDTAAIPTLPLVVAASLTALALEAYIASSFRVHQLHAAGRPVDAATVTHDTLRAMTGRDDVNFTKAGAQMLTRRMLRRWGRSVVPFVGIGYASWDARKTIRSLSQMPV